MSDLLCFGEPLVEFNQRPDGAFGIGFGGDTSNCAVAARRQGAHSGYLGSVGADRFGDSLIAFWRAEGVDIVNVRRDPVRPTGIYFVTHDSGTHEFTYYRRGSAASAFPADDLPTEAIARARYLHVSGISQAIGAAAREAVDRAIDIARAHETAVAFDTNYRPGLWGAQEARAAMDSAARRADVVLPSLDDARALIGLVRPDDVADYFLELGPSVVALTLGAQGALIATANHREHIAPLRVRALDATGAGDTFDGALIAALLRGDDPFDAGRTAVVAAGLATLGYGAIAPIPDLARVQAVLRDPDAQAF